MELLNGLRVLEMGHVAAVPAAAAILADWGADVTIVEPLSGELMRGMRRAIGVDVVEKYDGGEIVIPFEFFNRNKRGIALDLKSKDGQEIMKRLIARSDVFMTNYEASAVKQLGLSYDEVSKVNPAVIYALLTGYGTTGPDKDERGFDVTAFWARAGFQYLVRSPDADPTPQRGATGDITTSLALVSGIMGALYHKEKTGLGQEVQASLYGTGIWVMALDLQVALFGKHLPIRQRANPSQPLNNCYKTKDGRWFQLCMLQPDYYWPFVCRALDRPDLKEDPRFKYMLPREANAAELVIIMDEIFASKTWVEWRQLFQENGVICALVQSPDDVVADPQAHAAGYFSKVEHPVGAEIDLVASPVSFNKTPSTIRTVAPQLGQHTEEVLLELGYTWDDLEILKGKGVIL
jgi:crotonobetainyl-CoA:carnitine CoA-transferase CaiB-like acyl-CoA transferase